MTLLEESKKVPITCPICKAKKIIEIPESIIKNSSRLTTISLRKGLVCEHHFQIFIDKNFKVRGYQKVDLEMALSTKEREKKKNNKFDKDIKEDNEKLENLLIDGNYLEFQPKNCSKKNDFKDNHCSKNALKRKMSIKEIYEEFWEFIEDDNVEFKEFILNDERR